MNLSPSGTENKSPFWIGIREIYQKNYWGYQSNGKRVPTSFLTQSEKEQYFSKCAVIKEFQLTKVNCKHQLPFACEAGKK